MVRLGVFGLIRATILLLAIAFGAGAVLAQDYEKGYWAAMKGDYATALKEFRPLAEQGVVEAQNNLASMYYSGDGVPQNYAEAVKWYRLAAEQGSAKAQAMIGALYDIGKGVLQDNVRAHMWLSISAANGDKKAVEWRDGRAGLRTSADISKAQSMARECMSSNYKNCGW